MILKFVNLGVSAMKFSHTMIRVKNIDNSLHFYKEVLGLKLLRTMELEDATLYFVSDEKECCTIELTYNHQEPEGGYKHGNYFGHLAFETDDMNKLTEIMKKNGLEYVWEPFEVKKGGPVIAFLNDPDGFPIEIIERK